MRVLLDANLLIGYLLPSAKLNRSVDVIVEAGLSRRFTLLTTVELRREVAEAIDTKPWLRQHIPAEQEISLMLNVERRGELLPVMLQPPPRVCRDPRDDYLLAYAESGHADYLVTYDEDLLVLDSRFSFRIVRPAEFLAVLREQGLA